jgi:hypothetical protein
MSVHRDLGTLEPNPELPGMIAELGGYCPTCQRFICNCIARTSPRLSSTIQRKTVT